MPPLALFLGAGVSRPLGFPLTAEILPLILKRLREGTLFVRAEPEPGAELKRLLMELLPALLEPGMELPLITDLLSLVDQLLLDGHALGPELGPPALDRLRSLLDRAIAEVLGEPLPDQPGGEGLLERLTEWILQRQAPLALITTNYDLAIESRLYGRLSPQDVACAVDFGLSWRPTGGGGLCLRPPTARLGFFKLHGSLDWFGCSMCGHVSIDRGGAGGAARERAAANCPCGYGPLRHVFVAPSMVRELRDPNLMAVWHGALEALRTAEEWIIIGYSLPPEDVAVRTLLLRAWRSRPGPPRVRVIEGAADRALENRYRLLFPGLHFETGGVEGFVESLPRSVLTGGAS